MHEIEAIRTCLQQLGSDVVEINSIVEDEPGSWQIFFEDGYAISIHFMGERQTIELVAVLGAPEPDDELEVLRTMLCYQLLWRGGLEPRIALDAKIGALLCLCEFDLNIINRPEFANNVINFWVQSANLAEMVAEGIALSLPPAAAEIMHLHA